MSIDSKLDDNGSLPNIFLNQQIYFNAHLTGVKFIGKKVKDFFSIALGKEWA